MTKAYVTIAAFDETQATFCIEIKKQIMMRLKNVLIVPVYSFFLSLLLSCNEGESLQVTEEATLSNDSILSPMVFPDHKPTAIEQGFPEPVYPLLPLIISDDPCWEHPEEVE